VNTHPAQASPAQPAVREAQMRASDADREAAASLLNEAFAEGRLTADEHDQRLGAAYAARSWQQLQQLTADLPGVSGAATEPMAPARQVHLAVLAAFTVAGQPPPRDELQRIARAHRGDPGAALARHRPHHHRPRRRRPGTVDPAGGGGVCRRGRRTQLPVRGPQLRVHQLLHQRPRRAGLGAAPPRGHRHGHEPPGGAALRHRRVRHPHAGPTACRSVPRLPRRSGCWRGRRPGRGGPGRLRAPAAWATCWPSSCWRRLSGYWTWRPSSAPGCGRSRRGIRTKTSRMTPARWRSRRCAHLLAARWWPMITRRF